jgi:dolichyl-phosphate beta-glucosyltransferase
LDEALEYLEARQKKEKKFTYEIIIVDDGSKDKTSQVGLEYSKLELLGQEYRYLV